MKDLFSFFKKKRGGADVECTYDIEREKPVIRASICTGERVAGFKDIKTGAFHEIMLIRDQKDLECFMRTYGIDRLDTEY